MSGFTVRDFESKKAGADLSAKQFYLVKSNTAVEDGVVLAAAATDEIMGVLMDKPASGEWGAVAMISKGGKAPVKYGGTVAKGDKLTSDASGLAITTTTAGNKVIGIAVKAGVANDIGEVDLGVGPSVVP